MNTELKNRLIRLLNQYNEATDPGRYCSDLEHERNAKRARDAERQLTDSGFVYGIHWRELSTGFRLPINTEQ